MKVRSPLGAALLSLVVPGLGQLYNGQVRRALVLYLLTTAAYVAADIVWSSRVIQSSAAFYVGAGLLLFGIALLFLSVVDAFRGAHRIGAIELRRFNRWYVYCFIAALALSLLAVNQTMPFAIAFHRVLTSSMQPTLSLLDRMITVPNSYADRAPETGDLVVFKPPDPPEGRNLIWTPQTARVAALPGDRVEIRDGVLTINNDPATRQDVEPWADNSGRLGFGGTGYQHIPPDMASRRIPWPAEEGMNISYYELTVPAGSYFVLGDNRDHGVDGWLGIGLVPGENLMGRPAYILWAQDKSRIGTAIE